MNSEYLTYSIEELADDERFRAWVIRGEHAGEWERFMEEHPPFKEKAEKARDLVLLLHTPPASQLSEKDVREMWKNISHFHTQRKRGTRQVRLRKVFFRAAIFLLLLSLGTLAYFYLGNAQKKEEFTFSGKPAPDEYPHLILSNGEKIDIKKKKPRIVLEKNFELVINNDRVIDLSEKNKDLAGGENRMIEMVVPYGKYSEVRLPDGSKVFLNAGTRFAFPSAFTRKRREVFLEGEAYFEVAPDKTVPFLVHAGAVNIKVLGTHFNVTAYSRDPEIETVLLEGKVAVYKKRKMGIGGKEVILKPHQKASFNKQRDEITVTDEKDTDQYISWTDGWLCFTHKSLPFVFKKVERYYNTRIVLPENFNASPLISGKLDINGSLENVMKALADVGKFKYRMEGNVIYIEN